MTLADLWFVLFIVIIAGYLILDGFDMGVGILHLPLARNDAERRTFLASIGPVWDGNEVWLVLGGGVLFAVFPLAYASLFSGFYVAFMLFLLVLIFRTVAIEFRSQKPDARWRSAWDAAFALGSLGIALLLGVAFGNLLQGVPLDADGDITVSIIDLLTPFALLVGLTTVVMVAAHGSIYLAMKTEGELEQRVVRVTPALQITFIVLVTLICIALVMTDSPITTRYRQDIWPVVVPAAALLVYLSVVWLHRQGRMFAAFVASSATILLLLVSAGIGLYPNLIISSTDPAFNLTVSNAAAADNTLQVCLIVALIGMPFVLLYTAGVYYIFRGKVELEPEGY